jgi:1-deoxy-D-xylulose-5-phosphate synthase
MPDRYVTHGKPALLHREVDYTGKAIAERITAEIGRARARVRALHPQARR